MAQGSVITAFDTSFAISSENGDINTGGTEGFYYRDTRFLSSFKILLNGGETQGVIGEKFSHAISSFYDTALGTYGQPESSLSVVRDRLVEDSIHEDLWIKNHSSEKLQLKLEAIFEADFADVFEVRRGTVQRNKGKICSGKEFSRKICFSYDLKEFHGEIEISFSGKAKVQGNAALFEVALSPHEVWKTCVMINPIINGKKPASPKCVSEIIEPPFGPYRRRTGSIDVKPEDQTKPLSSSTIPELFTEDIGLRESYAKAISDLQSLRLHVIPGQYVLAAGLPWFMTLFGRDSIISAIQTKILGTGLLTGTYKTLASLQANSIDKFREAQPGKIPHELRRGELSVLGKVPHSCYYGSVDSTPLFVILLSEIYKWTGSEKFLKENIGHADYALEWVDKYGDMDNDGYVEYLGNTKEGLKNQGWKDSEDSVNFRDGTLAEGPIALVEVQGYVYAAKARMADLHMKLGNNERAEKLDKEAKQLKEKFNKTFWMPKEQFYAMALDGKKELVDSISSNPAHCLWTEIIDKTKAQAVVRRLLEDDMFTGWGIRTLSSQMTRFNPLSYHNGSVWPHDNSIAASGMSKYGFLEEANLIAHSLIDASSALPNRRLPELFAGYVRREDSRPVPYPLANSPQAWASGALIYCIETLLGMVDSGENLMQRARLDSNTISMNGIEYRGKRLRL